MLQLVSLCVVYKAHYLYPEPPYTVSQLLGIHAQDNLWRSVKILVSALILLPHSLFRLSLPLTMLFINPIMLLSCIPEENKSQRKANYRLTMVKYYNIVLAKLRSMQ